MTIVKKVAVLVYGLYLCVVVTIDDGIDMFKVLYFNGSFVRAEEESSKDVEQVGNAIIMASNEGWPFRGKPEDFARDALGRINDQLGFEIGLFPVILCSNGGQKWRLYNRSRFSSSILNSKTFREDILDV